MPSSLEISRTEERLSEVDALRQTVDDIKQDLHAYEEALRRELDWLREEASQGRVAVAPQPKPSADADPFPVPAELSEEELAAPLASPFELDDSDKHGGKPTSVLISDGSVSEEPFSGWVIDRPPGGLKILVDDEVRIGRVIGIRPTREHPDAEWINVSVKNIRPERQSFVLTCSFVGRPPWTALQLLNG